LGKTSEGGKRYEGNFSMNLVKLAVDGLPRGPMKEGRYGRKRNSGVGGEKRNSYERRPNR